MPQIEKSIKIWLSTCLLINSDISWLRSVTLKVHLCKLLVSKPVKLAFQCPFIVTSAHLINLKHPQSLKWTGFKTRSPIWFFFLNAVFIRNSHAVPPAFHHQILPWKQISDYLAGKVGATIKEVWNRLGGKAQHSKRVVVGVAVIFNRMVSHWQVTAAASLRAVTARRATLLYKIIALQKMLPAVFCSKSVRSL